MHSMVAPKTKDLDILEDMLSALRERSPMVEVKLVAGHRPLAFCAAASADLVDLASADLNPSPEDGRLAESPFLLLALSLL